MLPGMYVFLSSLIVIWTLLGAIMLIYGVYKYATRLGRDAGLWAFGAVIFSPIVVFLVLYMCGPEKDCIEEVDNTCENPTSRDTKKVKEKSDSIGTKLALFMVGFAIFVLLICLSAA